MCCYNQQVGMPTRQKEQMCSTKTRQVSRGWAVVGSVFAPFLSVKEALFSPREVSSSSLFVKDFPNPLTLTACKARANPAPSHLHTGDTLAPETLVYYLFPARSESQDLQARRPQCLVHRGGPVSN